MSLWFFSNKASDYYRIFLKWGSVGNQVQGFINAEITRKVGNRKNEMKTP